MEKGKVTVFRYNPAKDQTPYFETHEFPFWPGTFVLDVANHIYNKGIGRSTRPYSALVFVIRGH